jgi:4-amino-4-deoxy-L-arabinose transferase-like glycosyltransferase
VRRDVAVLAIVSAFAVVATALVLAASLRSKSIVSFLLSAYLAGWAELVVLTELLSLGRHVTRPGYAVGSIVLLAGALAAWHVFGRPRPPRVSFHLRDVGRHPVLVALAAVVVLAVAYEALLVVATPPNNGDSLSGHLSRVAVWYQGDGVHWIPDAHTPRQNEWPPDAQIGVLYTVVLLGGRDTLGALPQLLAELATALSVFGIARRLGFRRPDAAFAALVTLTLPQVALQSVTTQNDLVVASFIAAAAYFLHSATPAGAALAALATALALGTKATAILALPILAALALVVLPRRALATFAAAAVVAVAAVAAPGYARNVIHTDHLLGSGEAQSGYRPTAITWGGTSSSLAKLSWHMLDFTGYPLKPAMREPIADAGEAMFDALGIATYPLESSAFPFTFDPNIRSEEDTSFYGLLGFALLIPLCISTIARWRPGRASPAVLVHALAVPAYALFLVLAYKEGSWYGRYLLGGVVFLLPLVAALYRRRVLAAAIAVVGALGLVLAHAYNANKPTGIEKPAVWTMSRSEAQSLGLPGFERLIAAVNQNAGDHETIGAVMGEQDWDYPLMGDRLTRPIVFLHRRDALREAKDRGLRLVVLGRGLRVPRNPGGWRMLPFSWMGTVLIRRD